MSLAPVDPAIQLAAQAIHDAARALNTAIETAREDHDVVTRIEIVRRRTVAERHDHEHVTVDVVYPLPNLRSNAEEDDE